MENKIRNRMTKLSSSFPSNIQVPWGPNFGSARLYGIYIYILLDFIAYREKAWTRKFGRV